MKNFRRLNHSDNKGSKTTKPVASLAGSLSTAGIHIISYNVKASLFF